MKFGDAIEELKKGKCLYRNAWGEDVLFIFMQVPSTIPSHVVPNMTSVPSKVKEKLQIGFDDENQQIDAIYYQDQFAMIKVSNVIVSYSPSVSDCLAEDWEVLE